MNNNKELIDKLMIALECDEKFAQKKLNDFIAQTSTQRDADLKLFTTEVNHPDGWYRKFDKINKRK